MDKKIYIKDIIEDKDQMISLADLAKQDSHNFVNFENRIDNYLNYHTATYEGSVVAMAGIFQSDLWPPKFARVLDRTYYFKEARSSTLSFLNEKELKAIASTHFLPEQIDICLSKKLIPWFSIQGVKRRPAMYRMVDRWNQKHNHKFMILPKLYYTCNREPNNNIMCWQNVAILKVDGYGNFNLPSRPIK